MKKTATMILAIMCMNSPNAAFNGLSVHSRANCGNNESISWDWTYNWVFYTRSSHYKNGNLIHVVNTGWQKTWRSAAVHWGEGTGGWTVHGQHWHAYPDGTVFGLGEEIVTNCSIYDGWWDKNR